MLCTQDAARAHSNLKAHCLQACERASSTYGLSSSAFNNEICSHWHRITISFPPYSDTIETGKTFIVTPIV